MKQWKKEKQLLAVLLILALLCTAIPFTPAPSAHASTSGQHSWYSIEAKICSSWGGHIIGEITLANSSRNAVQDWQIDIPWQAQVTSMWNARYEQTEDGYVIRPMDYNAVLQPGERVIIGMSAEGEEAVLGSLVSVDFFTESGAAVTHAAERVPATPGPQEQPAPVREIPSVEETKVPETPSAAPPSTLSAPAETPAVEAAEAPEVSETPAAAPPSMPSAPAETPSVEAAEAPEAPEVSEAPAAAPPSTPSAPAETPAVEAEETPEAPSAVPAATPSAPTESPEPAETAAPDSTDRYITSDTVLQDDTVCANLYLLEGSLNLNGHTLTVQKNFHIYTSANSHYQNGTICLGGDLIQHASASPDSLQLGKYVTLRLNGTDAQKVELAYPQDSGLGVLDLRESTCVDMPEEIHADSLAGICNLHMGEELRLAVQEFRLDSDIRFPGNLILLGGDYRTGQYRVEIDGDLSAVGEQESKLFSDTGEITIHGDVDLAYGNLRVDGEAQGSVGGDVAVSGRGGLYVGRGALDIRGSLAMAEGASLTMWGGTLSVHETWENHNGVASNRGYNAGEIELYGDMNQYDGEHVNTVVFPQSIRLSLVGEEAQHIRLAHLEQADFGTLDLSGCREAYIFEEIHCHRIAGIRNLHMGEELRLAVQEFRLDSDIHFPGNLTLLGGDYRTGQYRVEIDGDLSAVGEQESKLFSDTGEITIHGDVDLAYGNLRVDGEAQGSVGGDVAVSGRGGLYVGRGALDIRGSLTMAEGASLTMWGGTLSVHETWENHNSVASNRGYNAGEIELYGDLEQYDGEEYSFVELSRSIIFCFKGEIQQTVRIAHLDQAEFGEVDLSGCRSVSFTSVEEEEDAYLSGARLEGMEKLVQSGSVLLEFETVTLTQDASCQGDLECQGKLEMNHHSLTVHGDFSMNGRICDPGTLDIYGSYTSTGGTTDIGTGSMRVRKNMYLKDEASLSMEKAEGKLLVEGNFKTSATGQSYLSAGVIELKGDLTCTQGAYMDNMKMTGTALVLSGNRRQNIDLYAGKACTSVARVDMSQASSVYIEGSLLCAQGVKGLDKIVNKNLILLDVREILEQDERFHGDLQISGSLLDCAGHSFIVDGSLDLAGIVCVLNHGMMLVRNDFNVIGKSVLQMREEEDQVTVGGDFWMASNLSHSGMLTNGRLVMSGNFLQEGDHCSFDSRDQFTAVFISTGEQYVRFSAPDTSQFANTEGDYIENYTLEEKICHVIDAVSYGVADGLGELLESPEELVAAGAAAAVVALGTALEIPLIGGAALFMGLISGISMLVESYTEMSGIENKYERLRDAIKEVTKIAVLSAVMKAGEQAGEKTGEFIKDTELWQRCCKWFRNRKQPDITAEDLKKIGMTAEEHLESVRVHMDEEAYDALRDYSKKHAEIDLMETAELIRTISTRSGLLLMKKDIQILYRRLAEEADAETIYHVLAVPECYEEYDDFTANFALEVGKDTLLTLEEKVWKLQKGYQKIVDQTDVMVPADVKYLKGFDAEGEAVYKWPKFLGFIRSTIRAITRDNGLPESLDRYGYNGGSNFAAVPEKGRYSFWERAIPYLRNEKSYHKFEVKHRENYCDKIDAIREGDFNKLNEILAREENNPITKTDFDNISNNYIEYLKKMKSENGITEDYTYGLNGTAACYNRKTPELMGGAEQFTLPLSANDLIMIKVLEEIK